MAHLLAIDQGTTSTRSIVFDHELNPVAHAQQEFRQIYPAPGLVEHDPEEIWSSVLATARNAIEKAGLTAKDVAVIGIPNQRETRMVGDGETANPLYNPIVWQDRGTADAWEKLKVQKHEPMISARTGLLLDPYFSATKIAF